MSKCLNYFPINFTPFSKLDSIYDVYLYLITFKNLLGITLSQAEDVTNARNNDIPEIIQYLKKNITEQIFKNVNTGLDLGNLGIVCHRRSQNHTVKLLKLDRGL